MFVGHRCLPGLIGKVPRSRIERGGNIAVSGSVETVAFLAGFPDFVSSLKRCLRHLALGLFLLSFCRLTTACFVCVRAVGRGVFIAAGRYQEHTNYYYSHDTDYTASR